MPLLICSVLIAGAVMSTGCNALGFLGAMEESRRRNSTKTVDAEYKGLKDKNYAVVVKVDRSIEADFPELVPYMTGEVTRRLVDQQAKINADGVVPTERVLRYLFDHPEWTTMAHGELAKALEVNRLILIEVFEYRLNEPGNAYLWEGIAAGTVGIVEADTSVRDEFAFQKPVRVQYPDQKGVGQQDMSRAVVATELARRFIDRTTWLFYSHQEPYYPKY